MERSLVRGTLVLGLALLLAACSGLPSEARQAVLRYFEPEEQARVYFAKRLDLLPEEESAGAEEVWCVNVEHRCWSCPHGEWRTCISSFWVRRVNGKWRATPVTSHQDLVQWEQRGCPREPEVVGQAPGPLLGTAAVLTLP